MPKKTDSNQRRICELKSSVARLSDEELMREIDKARREAGELLRSGSDIVALKDACAGCIDSIDAALTDLQQDRDEHEAKLDALDEELAALNGDRDALNAELNRLQREVEQRFRGDWSAAGMDKTTSNASSPL
jgi:chromosome segregation ATPase